MLTSVLSAVAGFFTALLQLLFTEYKQSKEQNKHEDKIEEFREALADDNAACVSGCINDQYDRVQQALRGG